MNTTFKAHVSCAVIPQDFLDAIAREHHLSKAEQEVFSLAMTGKSTAAIAQNLSISGDAVRKRLSEVYQKFHIGGRGPVKLTKLQQLIMERYQDRAQSPPHVSSRHSESSLSTNGSTSHPSTSVIPNGDSTSTIRYWGEAPDSSIFYGRESELTQLRQWLLDDQCRLVTVLGMAGIGKTALAVKLARQIQDVMEAVLWISLRHAPSLQEVLDHVSEILTSNSVNFPNSSLANTGSEDALEAQISSLIHYFREHHCLLVLDGAESILQSGRLAGIYREGYEEYGDLFKRLGQEPHQSCIVITSQEKPAEIALLEGETSPVRSLKLDGLQVADAEQLLIEKGLTGDTQKWIDLIRGYRGNPFMLKMVATTIRDVFDGNVPLFLKTTLFTHDISDYIEEILDRLSDLEEDILYQLASQSQPMAIDELMDTLPDSSPQDLIRALQSLKQRSLLETSEGRFNLPPAVMDVVLQTVED